MINDVNLDKLRIFSKVVEKSGVTAAASVLRVTPSAVSQALSSLEAELGFKLFERVGKVLKPTPEAIQLDQVVLQFLRSLQDSVTEIESRQSDLKGTLRIGAPPEFGAHQVMKHIAELANHSGARFQFTYGLPEELILKVLGGELDFSFCDSGPYLKKYDRLISSEVVHLEEAVLVGSPGIVTAQLRSNAKFDDLIKIPHCEYRADHKVLALWYTHHFGKSPRDLNLRVVAPTVRALIQAAKLGLGLTFIPSDLIRDELKRGELVEVRTRKSNYVNPIILVQKLEQVPSRLQKEFIQSFPRPNSRTQTKPSSSSRNKT